MKKIVNNKHFNWTLALAWVGLIFYLSSRSTFGVVLNSARQYEIISSLVHIFLYGILTFILTRSFIVSGFPMKKSLFYAFLLSVIYGATDEYHQKFTPGREMKLGDWLFDIVGSLIVVYFYNYYFKLKLFNKK